VIYFPLVDTAWKDPFGPQRYNSLVSNLRYVRANFDAEHIRVTGEHNVWEVPRVCRSINGTVVSPSSSDITAVANPAAGEYDLTLAAGRFTASRIRVQVGAPGADLKPWAVNAEIVSATSIKLRFQKLTSALGAGNAWAATNAAPFSVAIHSEPLARGTWAAMGGLRNAGVALSGDTSATQAEWSHFPRESAAAYKALTAAHTSAGVHNVREVARYYGLCSYDPVTPKYTVSGSAALGAVSRTSAGIVVVNYTALTTPVSAFASPMFAASGGTTGDTYLIASTPGVSSTTFYLYKYNFAAKTWAAADGDFFFVIHGS